MSKNYVISYETAQDEARSSPNRKRNGASSRIRTEDRRFTKPLLYH